MHASPLSDDDNDSTTHIMQIKRLIANFGLPLLAKELTEQAARKRTYVIRVVYAAILFLMASLFFYQTLQFATSSPLAVLGHGKNMFATLVGMQFAGIYLFMPAMTCSVLTQEKERASLQLLFLTRLGPWTILFEKLLGRLVPMGGFVLLSLPLLGFAYTLGGVSREMLWKGAWMLFLASIQMGTLAIMCSAFFRTTVGAFMASYVIAFLMFFGPYFCLMIAMFAGWALNLNFERIFADLIPSASPGLIIIALFPLFTPPYFLSDTAGNRRIRDLDDGRALSAGSGRQRGLSGAVPAIHRGSRVSSARQFAEVAIQGAPPPGGRVEPRLAGTAVIRG